ncbi:uncharacterized protein SCHCODRAFT_02520200 [Schizophyllum commune H4-8]|nr:uncharacterized protein SCHCODRAFT_02520200 [Schizophyllum commune H4-8]KAI5885510.1 hypothetical protein SCHCODRAFT_02520200 [Schizophyllum commune H4-8]
MASGLADPPKLLKAGVQMHTGVRSGHCSRESTTTNEDMEKDLPTAKDACTGRAPIDVLPPEIIERIFFHCHPVHDDFMPKWPTRNSLEWITVTWICSRWRAIATSSPTLWSTIDLCYNRPTDVGRTFLERSRKAPLTVFLYSTELGCSPDDIAVFAQIGSNHVDRLATLHVSVASWVDFEHVYGLLGGKTSTLQSLSLFLQSCDSVTQKCSTTDPDLFAAQLHNVRKLAVRHCAYSQFTSFSGLTHLAVCSIETVSRDDLHQFWHLLQRSPQLEALLLAKCSIVDGDQTTRPKSYLPPQVISLPHLRKLQLSEVIDPTPFLSRLDVPETCRVWMKGLLWRAECRALPLLLPPAGRCAPLMQPIHTLQLSTIDPRPGNLWVRPGTIAINGDYHLKFERLVETISSHSRLVLLLGCRPSTTPAGLARMLSSMPRIQTIDIYCLEARGAESFLEALVLPQDSAGTLPCPALEVHLSIAYEDFTADAVWDVVVSRARAGVPLRELRIQHDRVKRPPHFINRFSSRAVWQPKPVGMRESVTLDTSGAPTSRVTEELRSGIRTAGIMRQLRSGPGIFCSTDGDKWGDKTCKDERRHDSSD